MFHPVEVPAHAALIVGAIAYGTVGKSNDCERPTEGIWGGGKGSYQAVLESGITPSLGITYTYNYLHVRYTDNYVYIRTPERRLIRMLSILSPLLASLMSGLEFDVSLPRSTMDKVLGWGGG